MMDNTTHNRLPDAQHTMIRLWVLGGVDAIGHHATTTVDALIRQRYLDKHGPTDIARAYVNDTEFNH